jgi:hypothetical protein
VLEPEAVAEDVADDVEDEAVVDMVEMKPAAVEVSGLVWKLFLSCDAFSEPNPVGLDRNRGNIPFMNN